MNCWLPRLFWFPRHLSICISWIVLLFDENTDGLGGSGPQQVISVDADAAHSVFSADIDGDGDMDVLSASSSDNKITWHENMNGQGDFGGGQVISLDSDGARSVFAIDLDGDSDIDVLSAFGNKIAWHENTNGRGDFGDRQIIAADADGARSVFAIDLDLDGDIDVLSAAQLAGRIAWYENTDGQGAFGPRQVITADADAAQSVFAADLDADGDVDVLAASVLNGKIAWFENLSLITAIAGPAVEPTEFELFANYPNPFNPETVIKYELARGAEVRLEIYNLVGQKIATLVNEKLESGVHSITWNGRDALGSPVASGVYFYRLKTSSFVASKKMLLLR